MRVDVVDVQASKLSSSGHCSSMGGESFQALLIQRSIIYMQLSEKLVGFERLDGDFFFYIKETKQCTESKKKILCIMRSALGSHKPELLQILALVPRSQDLPRLQASHTGYS